MLIAPNSDIYLLKTPFEMDSENVLTFNNYEEQYNYFSSLPKLLLEGATYQRKDGVVRYPGTFDDLIEYNYCMYRNTSYSDKWFYAYIEDMKYENNSMTSIKLKTDVWQTWQFQINYKSMFVVREHVNDDRIGVHTLPENLETGEFICTKSAHLNYTSNWSYNDLKVVIGVTRDYVNMNYISGGNYGAYSGLKYYAFNLNDTTSINDFIDDYAQQGFIEDIRCLFLAPSVMCNVDSNKAVVNRTTPYNDTGTFTLSNSLNGYVPKNNKLYVSPYNYLVVDNHAGAQAKYNLEDMILPANPFSTDAISFGVIGTLGIGCSSFMYPEMYKTTGIEYGIPFGKLPTLSWVGDSYTNWLTQNSVNMRMEVGKLIMGGAFLVTGGEYAIPFTEGGLRGIVSELKNRYDHSFMPAQTGGQMGAVDVLASDERLEPTIYQMCVKQEYAKIIDDYMSAYGYQVNSYKVPNITGRRNWNFVKTSGCNIYGDIPQNDLQEIKEMFNKGVTFWHHANTFLDYSQNNDII